jgi:cellulose synthase/poly-beta-1,6-N-acetylglucosamine synthase-like glycosyltransferase
MGISELRQLGVQRLKDVSIDGTIGEELVKSGKVSRTDALLAQLVARQCDTSLDRILTSEGLVTEDDLLSAHARRSRMRRLSATEVAEARISDVSLDPRKMLKHGFVPLQDEQERPVLVLSNMDQLRRIATDLPVDIATASRVLAPRDAVQARIVAAHGPHLTDLAQARVNALESCRNWEPRINPRMVLVIGALAILCAITVLFPTTVLAMLVLWATLTLLVTAGMKTAAAIAQLSARPPPPQDEATEATREPLPSVSVLVPLFREREMLHALIARLTQLTYPKCLLDVVLVLEEADDLTQEALAEIDMPSWIRAVVVPDGKPRTKPRAMNYALDFCEGDIIGIFDAEDAPDPDQITVVARRFAHLPREVACLQGILDYYNPQQNWLARCFTIEYAAWFRMILPGMARLGFAIPLGGTTLYFRRDVLEELGGWDAHNVTEDADLGFRLARHGYRTEMVNTVTEEEANCRIWPWIKQRSRWLKGYMVTYVVHMRRPRLLHRQLGAWKFWGFQAHFVSALSQVLLAPLLWSFWLILLGLPHPLDPVVPRDILVAAGLTFLMLEVLNMTIYAAAVCTNKHKALLPWVPLMHVYSPLGAIAAYKAVYELIFKPFFWDKTAHGLSLGLVSVPTPRASDHAVDLAAVELQPGHERL